MDERHELPWIVVGGLYKPQALREISMLVLIRPWTGCERHRLGTKRRAPFGQGYKSLLQLSFTYFILPVHFPARPYARHVQLLHCMIRQNCCRRQLQLQSSVRRHLGYGSSRLSDSACILFHPFGAS